MNPMHSAEQQLNLALQQNEPQQRMSSHVSERLAATEAAGKIDEEKVQLLTNQLNSAALAAADVASLATAAKAPPSSPPLQSSQPTPFSGLSDTILPWMHQVATHLYLVYIIEPTTQYLGLPSSSHPVC
jgi:hypothetical protein